MNDETELYHCPFGLDRESDLYPDPEKRTLRLTAPPEAVEVLSAISNKVMQKFEELHAQWECPSNLQFDPLVKMHDDIGPMVKFKVHLKETVIKRFNPNMTAVKKADYKVINPGSECVILVSSAGIWIGDEKYGLTLNAKLLLVKPGEKKQFGINDLVLQSAITE